MNLTSLQFVDAPILSNEAANEIRAFLYELIDAYEHQYGEQLQRFQKEYLERKERESDLFDDIEEDFDDEILF